MTEPQLTDDDLARITRRLDEPGRDVYMGAFAAADMRRLLAEVERLRAGLAAGRAALTDRIDQWQAQQEVWQNMPTSALDSADLLRIEFEQARKGEVEDLLDRFDAAVGLEPEEDE